MSKSIQPAIAELFLSQHPQGRPIEFAWRLIRRRRRPFLLLPVSAASLLWRDVAEHPARVTGLAFLGLAVYIGIDLLFTGLSGVAFFWAAMAKGHPLHLDSIGWKLWFTAPVLVSSLLIGRMLARWAPRRELAACVVYAILASIYNLVPMLGDSGVFSALLCILIVPAGAAWGRYRRLGAT